MSFPIPQYPLVGSRWIQPNKPSLAVADVNNIPFQKYLSPHFSTFFGSATVGGLPSNAGVMVWIETPNDGTVWNRKDVIEPVTGSGDYYVVLFKEVAYQGFPLQERLVLLCSQCNANATFPRTY